MKYHPYRTMTEAVEDLRTRGYTANFEFLHNAFQAVNSKRTFTAEELTIVEHHRFEGASDPDDESVVYAIQCDDGTQGILVDAYGIYANPELETFLEDVRIQEDG